MAHTAPPGYESNHAAMLDFMRYGPAIWSCSQVLALMFHIERSLAYGKTADEHSEDQALDGIYSNQKLDWVRGPAGLSRATWYRANNELEIDTEKPGTNPNAVLIRTRRTHGNQVTEYEVDWKAFKAIISRWKQGHQSRSETGKHKSTRLNLRRVPAEAPVSNWDGYPSQAETSTFADSKRESAGYPSQSETHSQSLDFKSDLTSPSDEISRAAVNLELELASGERPRTDGPSDMILEANKKYGLLAEVVKRFLHEKGGDFRARGYKFNPMTLARAFTEDVIPWLRKTENKYFVEECRRRRNAERDKASALREMQTPEAKEEQRLLDQAVASKDQRLTEELMAEVNLKRKAKGAR